MASGIFTETRPASAGIALGEFLAVKFRQN